MATRRTDRRDGGAAARRDLAGITLTPFSLRERKAMGIGGGVIHRRTRKAYRGGRLADDYTTQRACGLRVAAGAGAGSEGRHDGAGGVGGHPCVGSYRREGFIGVLSSHAASGENRPATVGGVR